MSKKLAGMMLTHNNGNDIYFDRILRRTIEFVDDLFILDDNSQDNTIEICRKYTDRIFPASRSYNEGEVFLRKELLDIVINNSNPDYLYQVDSDDMVCISREKVQELMENDEYYWYGLLWFNMWKDESMYKGPVGFAPRLFKNIGNFEWDLTKLFHVNIPDSIIKLGGKYTNNIIKHFGQINNILIEEKYKRKTIIEDPERIYFSEEEYDKYLKNESEVYIMSDDVSKIYTEEFFEAIKTSEIPSSKEFAEIIKNYINPNTCIDIGCGSGIYVKALNDVGIDTIGYDGSINAVITSIAESGKVLVHDFREDFDTKERYDLCISIEVAEHIKEEYSEQLVRNLTKVSDMILFTAAIPGQGGHDHVNEQPHEFWIELFKKYGFYADEELTEIMRKEMIEKNVVWWICNLIIFRKEINDE